MWRKGEVSGGTGRSAGRGDCSLDIMYDRREKLKKGDSNIDKWLAVFQKIRP